MFASAAPDPRHPGPVATLPETDPDAVLARLVGGVEDRSGAPLSRADPEFLLAETTAAEVARLYAALGVAVDQNAVDAATGDHLDALVALVGVRRREPAVATATVRLFRADGFVGPVVVPAGTRVALLDAVFATDAEAVLPTADQLADVAATAAAPGASANGYLAGAPLEVLDAVAGVGRAQLATATQGGADRETDAELRARAPLGMSRLAAGTAQHYRLLAVAAHPEVYEAAVSSPAPGAVAVTVAGRDGAVPSASAVAAVGAALSADDVRLVCDTVSVSAPAVVEGALDVTWFLAQAYAARADEVERAVLGAVDAYRAWQEGGLGRDVTPSRLVQAVQAAHPGVHRVEVAQPAAHVAVAAGEVVRLRYDGVRLGGVLDR